MKIKIRNLISEINYWFHKEIETSSLINEYCEQISQSNEHFEIEINQFDSLNPYGEIR